MAHEQSTTLQNKDGRWVNLDTMHGGKKVPQRVLERWLEQGNIKPLGGKTFATESEAVKAAKKRSKSFDKRPSRPSHPFKLMSGR